MARMLKPRTFFWLWLLLGSLASGCSSYSKEQNQEMQRIRDEVSANPQSINSLVERGTTRLHLAVINNYVPLIDWLRSHGADPNAKGIYGDTPLHVAIISDRTADGRVIRRLLSMGADVNARNNYGDTPLHRAAYHGLTSRVLLLLKSKADITARASGGETPLLYAVRPEGHPETVVAQAERARKLRPRGHAARAEPTHPHRAVGGGSENGRVTPPPDGLPEPLADFSTATRAWFEGSFQAATPAQTISLVTRRMPRR